MISSKRSKCFKVIQTGILLFVMIGLILILKVSDKVYAAVPGVNGPYCDDSSQAVEPQTSQPRDLIKFISSGQNHVGDFTTGGLVNAPTNNPITNQKRGSVSHMTSNGLQALERVHAVNENGKNVDYYAASSQCGTYTWYHGWDCTEQGDINICNCVHSVQYQICGSGTVIPTSVPIPTDIVPTTTPNPTTSLISTGDFFPTTAPTAIPTVALPIKPMEFPTSDPFMAYPEPTHSIIAMPQFQGFGSLQMPLIKTGGNVIQQTEMFSGMLLTNSQILLHTVIQGFLQEAGF